MIPDLSSRRRQLSEQIARQRQELGSAYRNLAKPFQYAESSLAGLKVLRKSAGCSRWPLRRSASPSAFSAGRKRARRTGSTVSATRPPAEPKS